MAVGEEQLEAPAEGLERVLVIVTEEPHTLTGEPTGWDTNRRITSAGVLQHRPIEILPRTGGVVALTQHYLLLIVEIQHVLLDGTH